MTRANNTETRLVAALAANDQEAISYWASKGPNPSLSLCYLLHQNFPWDKDIELSDVTYLLDAGANVNSICDREFETQATPLHMAVNRMQDNILDLLLAKGADPNLEIKTSAGGKIITQSSPLLVAILERFHADKGDKPAYLIIAKKLIGARANIDMQGGEQNYSPLISAVHHGDEEMLSLLLGAGAKKGLRDADGKTAEDHAADYGAIELARSLKP